MLNPYKEDLDQFFSDLLYYRHISYRINKVFEREIKDYNDDNAIIHFASALVISDWTEPTDNGWEVNFHTGIFKETKKDYYELEIRKILSRQLCLLFAQSFEAFERFVKDCLFRRIGSDVSIKEYAISLLPKNQQPSITRKRMPGGQTLFRLLKKAGGVTFIKFTSENNLNIKFSDLWTILSEARHSITHNESLLESELIKQTQHYDDIFNFLFNLKEVATDSFLIELDYKKFEKLIKRFSEFAYQIFKILSVEEELEWKVSR